MISIADNPAVTDPRGALTLAQQKALIAIDHYRHQKRLGPRIQIGQSKFRRSTISELEQAGMIKMRGDAYAPTIAGELAVKKLRGDRP